MKKRTLLMVFAVAASVTSMQAVTAASAASIHATSPQAGQPLELKGIQWAPNVNLTDAEKAEMNALVGDRFISDGHELNNLIGELPLRDGARAYSLLGKGTGDSGVKWLGVNNPNVLNVTADLIGGAADLAALSSHNESVHKAVAAGEQLAALLGARPNYATIYNAGWRFNERLNRVKKARQIAQAIKEMKKKDRQDLRKSQIISGALLGLEGVLRVGSLGQSYKEAFSTDFIANILATARRARARKQYLHLLELADANATDDDDYDDNDDDDDQDDDDDDDDDE